MDVEKYNLTWNDYPDHLRGLMHDLMVSEDFADVTLVTDDKKKVRAHRHVLSACSPVFKEILQIEKQNNHPFMYLRGIQYSEIEPILQFMYLGEAKLYEERLNEFLSAARDLICSKKHIQSKHEGFMYGCNQCDKQFIKRRDVTRHIKSKHEGIRYACKQCDKHYVDQPKLNRHIQTIHECSKHE